MFIFSNLATSLDGKIATVSRVHFPIGTPYDRKLMQTLRKRSDAVLFGASTLRSFKRFCGVKGAKKQPINVILSSTLEGISPKFPFFSDPTHRRILFVSADAPQKRIAPFSSSCEVIRLKRRGSVARQMVSELEKRGVKNLLVEGGGGVMWDFVSEDLIDEYYITHVPRLIGGVRAPTLVDGPGLQPKDVVNVRLKKCRKVGDELYLVYERTGKRG